jgi:flagellar biosynthesis protein FlhG
MTLRDRLQRTAGNKESKSGRTRIADSKQSTLKSKRPRILAVTSGKGGVGKTNVVVNLSARLAELGKKIVVLDADFGLGNIDILIGLTPQYNLGHVLFGNKTLSEIMIQGPNGIRIIPASSGLQRMSELTLAQRNHLVENFTNLDSDIDYFIIDTAAGISRNVIHFLLSAQEVIVVSAPEPTAIVDAYALIKIILIEDFEKRIQVLINSVERAKDAQEVFHQMNSVVQRFFNRGLDYLGHIKRDPHVPEAVRRQMLVTHCFPNAPASRCFRNIARRIAQQEDSALSSNELVWKNLLNDWIN